MKVAIGSDHGGFELKEIIEAYLKEKGYEVEDFGTHDQASADYPVYGVKVARAVVAGEYDLGLLFCGTGIGISIAANKVKGARACACSEPLSAKLSRQHNNANLLCLGGRVVGEEMAKMMVDAFLTTEFEGGRHSRRVNEMMDYERGVWEPGV